MRHQHVPATVLYAELWEAAVSHFYPIINSLNCTPLSLSDICRVSFLINPSHCVPFELPDVRNHGTSLTPLQLYNRLSGERHSKPAGCQLSPLHLQVHAMKLIF